MLACINTTSFVKKAEHGNYYNESISHEIGIVDSQLQLHLSNTENQFVLQ